MPEAVDKSGASGQGAAPWSQNLWTSPAALAAGLGVLLVVRLLALNANATDLFFDEAQYWSWSEAPAFGYYSKPPLIAWIIHLATSVCGASTACVRLPAPILHTLTAALVAGIGRQLYDTRVAVLSGLAFATLPGVSLSSGIISTDAPLLTCWAGALASFIALLKSRARWPALALGVSFGLGLNAKYAMAWFVPLGLAYGVMAPEHGRRLLRDWRVYAGLAIGLMMIAPNLAWNASHSFATFAHTAENANWHGIPFHPGKALEFLGSQLGVFGPVLFTVLVVMAWRMRRKMPTGPDALLAAYSLPLIAVILVQALLSRAHANWAAVAYVSATVLVVAQLVRTLEHGWLKRSFALHVAVVPILALATAYAGQLALPVVGDPFARTLGWRALAEATQAQIEAARARGKPYAAVLSEDRAVTAELLYYMRAEATPVLAWRAGSAPHDHFELTRPYTAAIAGPVLLVANRPEAAAVAQAFANAQVVGVENLSAGSHTVRAVTFIALSGYTRK